MFWGSGGSKSRLTKAAGAGPSGRMRDQNLHAAAARSTFGSQNFKNTSGSDCLCTLRCRKSVLRCGPKHMLKWKRAKHTIVGALLEVQLLKKCTGFVARSTFRNQNVENTSLSEQFFGCWDDGKAHAVAREAHVQVKSAKNGRSRALLDVEMPKTCTAL